MERGTCGGVCSHGNQMKPSQVHTQPLTSVAICMLGQECSWDSGRGEGCSRDSGRGGFAL